MTAAEPDLFDFLPEVIAERDAAAAERAAQEALWNAPATCPSCGTTEPNGWLLQTNHGYRPGEPGACGFPRGEHPIYGGMCTAQYLVRNHLTYAAHHPEDGPAFLAERMERGRELGLDVDAIVSAARAAMEAVVVSGDLLFGEPGKREERVEWGQRSIRDNFLVGPKGTVRPASGEQAARCYDGAFYPGGPVMVEPVRRTVVTYTTPWERA